MPKCNFCPHDEPAALMELKAIPDGVRDRGRNPEAYVVCANCLIALVMTCLSPQQYRSAIDAGCDPEWFYLHDDFYDRETGEALQPKI